MEGPRRAEGIVSTPDLSLLPLGSPEFWRAALGVVRSALRRSRVSIVVRCGKVLVTPTYGATHDNPRPGRWLGRGWTCVE